MPDAAQVIAYKFANALVADAAPNAVAKAYGVEGVLNRFKEKFGGLWVSGTVSLTSQNLIFVPNALNRAVHASLHAKTIPLADVIQVSERSGWVTRTVDIVRADGSIFAFRCMGARTFAEKIGVAAARVRSR